MGLDSSNSNAERTDVKLSSAYKFGLREAQNNDVAVSLDTQNKQLKIELQSNAQKYVCEVKLIKKVENFFHRQMHFLEQIITWR